MEVVAEGRRPGAWLAESVALVSRGLSQVREILVRGCKRRREYVVISSVSCLLGAVL
jgi:hypothetical protein